jgi:hypothetical protein
MQQQQQGRQDSQVDGFVVLVGLPAAYSILYYSILLLLPWQPVLVKTCLYTDRQTPSQDSQSKVQ